MISKEFIIKLDEKITESHFSGKLEIYYNMGGHIGYQISKRDKELEKEMNEKLK